jgi:hypothetical protein
MSEELSKKIEQVQSQLEEIRNNISRINDKMLSIEDISAPDSYIRDYSTKRLDGIKSQLQNAIEFLDKDENLVEQVKIKRYFEKFFSKLYPLILMFELYYAFRIAHIIASPRGDAIDLIAVDRTLGGFYIPRDSFEEFIDAKDYISVRTELSRIKGTFDAVSSAWGKVYE